MASMLRITHTRGRMAPAVEHFAKARVRVGSAAGSELYFKPPEAPPVAPAHAEIRWEENAWRVVDLGAPPGTFVNARRIAREALKSGDVVRLGNDGPEFRVDIVPAPASAGGASRVVATPGSSSDSTVDLATAHQLVADAVSRASVASMSTHRDKAESIITAKLGAAQKRTSRVNMLLTMGLGVTFVALVATAAFVWDAQRRASELTTEAGVGKTGGKRPKGSIPERIYTGREIFEENKGAVYLMGWRSGSTVGGSCTAFAIKSNVLATNAHCINALKQKGGTPIVTQNESGGNVRLKILSWSIHPKYKAGKSSADAADVGLLRVEGTMAKVVTLANDAELRSLGPGDDVFVIGFPGRVMDPVSPVATFLQGHVGRLMGLGEAVPESPEEAVLIQHDAVTRGGNSGSPMFNQYGHVVAVHAAHLDDEADVKVDGKSTTVVDASPYRVAMRIDLLRQVAAP